MSLEGLRDQIQAGELAQNVVADERAFYDLWLREIAGVGDGLCQAVRGGACADRFAWVFMSGYQPAIAHTFPDTRFAGWASYAVSEDRSGELAPVTWRRSGEDFVLDGYKTWVAGVENMRQLIVKAGRGTDARYFVIDRDAAGLHLSTKPEGFLAEMTEGVAHLSGVRLSDADALDARHVKRFGARECLYIYAAFCGMVAAKCTAAELVEQAWALIERAAPLLESPQDADPVKSFDTDIQTLRQAARPCMRGVSGWDTDQRLIAMYSNPIQSR